LPYKRSGKTAGSGAGYALPSTKAAFDLSYASVAAAPVAIAALLLASPLVRKIRRVPAGRCRRCRYDLTGNVSGRCPECGEPTAPLPATPITPGRHTQLPKLLRIGLISLTTAGMLASLTLEGLTFLESLYWSLNDRTPRSLFDGLHIDVWRT